MEYRYVEILRDGTWARDKFENIKKGDTYKMFEPDGTFVVQAVALEDAEPCEPEGNWKVSIELVEELE